jgi:hypothetical protein
MADILTIPRSNALRLVNTGKTGYATKRGGFDERLYIDEFWAYETWLPYNQCFDTGQTIRLQIITNYLSVSYEIYAYPNGTATVTTGTLTPDIYVYENGLSVHETSIDLLPNGVYELRLLASEYGRNSLTYKSEPFEIKDCSDLTKIEWYNSDTDGYYWHDEYYQCFYLEAVDFSYINESKSTVFEDYNNNPILLRATNKRQINFKTNPIPRWVAEKIVLAAAHLNVKLNNISFTFDKPKASLIDIDSPLYLVEGIASELNYENYDLFEASEGTPSVSNKVLGYSDSGTDTKFRINQAELIVDKTIPPPSGIVTTPSNVYLTKITLQLYAGSPIVSIGSTVGGTNYLNAYTLTSDYDVTINLQCDTTTNIYVTVSGGGVNAKQYYENDAIKLKYF